jgi:hypothetical protein
MDADDISLPERLQLQFSFMELNKDITVCGTYASTIGKINGYALKFFTKPEDIKANLLFSTTLAHPSVIIRKEILNKYNLRYDENFKHAEDYDLWERISNRSLLANMPKILLKHRIHEESVSEMYSKIQLANANKIRLRQLQKLGITLNDEDFDKYLRLKNNSLLKTDEFIDQQEKWLMQILEANRKKNIYDNQALIKVIKNRFYNICDANASMGMLIFNKYLNSPIKKLSPKDGNSLIKLLIKSLLKK